MPERNPANDSVGTQPTSAAVASPEGSAGAEATAAGTDGATTGGERGERQNIASNLDGALFGGALDFLNALRMGHRADVPDVVQNVAGIGDKQHR